MVNVELAKDDPASVFKKPSDVLMDASLAREEKIDILERWAYDEREKAVAEEENMRSTVLSKENRLDEILKALLTLHTDSDEPLSPPTKEG